MVLTDFCVNDFTAPDKDIRLLCSTLVKGTELDEGVVRNEEYVVVGSLHKTARR